MARSPIVQRLAQLAPRLFGVATLDMAATLTGTAMASVASEVVLAFLLTAVAIVPSGETFSCTPTRVWDGDGPIWCAEGPRIRLEGIAAREMDGTCNANQPCPSATAEQARDTLARLLGRITGSTSEGHLLIEGPAIKCVSAGGAGGNRTAATCMTPSGSNLSCAMIKSGTAMRWPKYDVKLRLAKC